MGKRVLGVGLEAVTRR